MTMVESLKNIYPKFYPKFYPKSYPKFYPNFYPKRYPTFIRNLYQFIPKLSEFYPSLSVIRYPLSENIPFLSESYPKENSLSEVYTKFIPNLYQNLVILFYYPVLSEILANSIVILSNYTEIYQYFYTKNK